MSFERLVQEGKQKIAEALRIKRPVILPFIQGTPQAFGEERIALITRANEIVAGENFNPLFFAEFVKTMRGLVGHTDRGMSGAFPYNLNRGDGTNGYLEFWGANENAQISIVRLLQESIGERMVWVEKEITIYHPKEELSGFALRMALPIKSHDLYYLDQLLNTGEGITFTSEPRSPGGGKGSATLMRTLLSETLVQNFCRKILGRFENIPQDHIFEDGETIHARYDKLNETSRNSSRRYN